MANSAPSPDTPQLDPDLIADLAADLAQASWFVGHVDSLLGGRAREALTRDQRVPALLELRDSADPAALLTRLFVLGSTEEQSDVDEALPATLAEGLVALGLARVEDGLVAPLFDLRPHAADLPDGEHHWWIASDLGETTTGRPLAPDHVLGIGGATTSLLTMTIRDHVDSALDIGTGCGVQALYLATHAERVVATDLSARACAITTFNAALNGVDLDVRQGSLFEPVAGERFDLVVSNPPFVITPQSVRDGGPGLLEYRDGGMDRDTLVATVVRDVSDHLTPGGTAQLLANWEIPAALDPDTEWSSRVAGWLAGTDLDAWVVQRDVLDPARYVEMWMRDSGGSLQGRDEWEATYSRWLEDFDGAGVGAVGMGFLALRAPSSPSGAATPRPTTPTDEGGPALVDGEDPRAGGTPGTQGDPARVFEEVLGGRVPRGEDVKRALATLAAPVGLWDLHPVRASDVREERHYVPGAEDPELIVLHQGGAMGRSLRVGSATAALVGACDGELSLSQIVVAIAVLTGQDASDLREQVGEPVVQMLRAGMLTTD